MSTRVGSRRLDSLRLFHLKGLWSVLFAYVARMTLQGFWEKTGSVRKFGELVHSRKLL